MAIDPAHLITGMLFVANDELHHGLRIDGFISLTNTNITTNDNLLPHLVIARNSYASQWRVSDSVIITYFFPVHASYASIITEHDLLTRYHLASEKEAMTIASWK